MKLVATSFALKVAAMPAVLLVTTAGAVGDPTHGARVFQACMACHSVQPGEHLTGPSLAGVWNRKAASAAGFSRYSPALKSADLVWQQGNLDKWLTDPQGFLPGTSMTFPGIKNERDRADVIAYLQAVAENKAPATPRQGGGMMGMGASRPNLKNAPPEGRVTALSYCGDTYTVRTADDQTQKVWEYNLRFKTDSSRNGPQPGKPVIIGAGMQGDRASVIFAVPSEISTFIKQACP